jgi:hypothetical protein
MREGLEQPPVRLAGFLVVAKLERTLITKGSGALRGTASVAFPSLRQLGEFLFPGQAMHDAQLYDVQPVIERAGHHRQTRAGLLVKRPESQVIALQIVQRVRTPRQKSSCADLSFVARK